jgi:hypothetical protein
LTTAGNHISFFPEEALRMPSNFQRILARVAWLVPLLLVGLCVNQAKVARDLRITLSDGIGATARVAEYERVDRADITYGYVSLEVPLPDGSVLTREKMSLPYSLMQEIEGREQLSVHVLRDAGQTIVIDMVVDTQWKIAAIQSAVSFFAALMALAAVVGWNRSVKGAAAVEPAQPAALSSSGESL